MKSCKEDPKLRAYLKNNLAENISHSSEALKIQYIKRVRHCKCGQELSHYNPNSHCYACGLKGGND